MSLFGSLMGDFEEDPFFGVHMRTMRQMNSMMNSMFGDPFGFMDTMGPPALAAPRAIGPRRGGELMPFGGFMNMNMNRIFQDFESLHNTPNCHSFSSSTVMTMTSGPDGRPQVYQASSSTRTAPGGVKEVKKSVCDSRTGVKKMAIGHHIGERAHVLEREQNLLSGDREERQEFINLEEEEADDFNREFEQRTRRSVGAIGYSSPTQQAAPRREREAMRALPAPVAAAPAAASSRSRARGNIESRRRTNRSALQSNSGGGDGNTDGGQSTLAVTSSSQERSRKRDHEPDDQRCHKALKPSRETSM